MNTLKIHEIIKIVLENDLKYVGFHQSSAQRTISNLPMLNPIVQLNLIWKEFCDYLLNKLSEGNSIKIRNFGIFSYTNNNLISTLNNRQFTKSFLDNNVFNVKKISFQLDKIYQEVLNHYPAVNYNKRILQPLDFISPKHYVEWNPFNISQKCYLKDIIVRDGINSIFQAAFDLVKAGKNISINFGFCQISFINQEIKIQFKSNFDN